MGRPLWDTFTIPLCINHPNPSAEPLVITQHYRFVADPIVRVESRVVEENLACPAESRNTTAFESFGHLSVTPEEAKGRKGESYWYSPEGDGAEGIPSEF
jgi:hypothetical protein